MTNLIFSLILFPFFIFFVYVVVGFPDNIFFALTNFIIITLSFFLLFLSDRNMFSLCKTAYFFILVFFGFVPLNDYSNGYLYWGGRDISADSLILTNIVIIFGIVFFYIGQILSGLKKIEFQCLYINKHNHILLLIFYCIVGLFILDFHDYSFMQLLFRSSIDELLGFEQVVSGKIVNLVFDNFIRPMPVIISFIFLIESRKNNINTMSFYNKMKVLFIFLTSIVLVAPTSIPRFQAAVLYIPFIIYFTNLWVRPFTFQFTLLFGLFILFPFLDKFRVFDYNNFTWSLDFKFLSHGHFDAYQNFARVIDLDITTWGNQLIGSLLFFVPRSVWDSKPIGSGAFVADIAGYDWNNISMPFIAEGYLNFGIFGVVLFMFSFGFTLSFIDKLSWFCYKKNINSLFFLFYSFCIGFVFFIMRGDLMSSFAYLCGFILAFFILIMLFFSKAQRIFK
jgi:hypothetical protein